MWRQSSLMKATYPVFVVGVARSGTSILYRVLQQHSSFRLAHCQPGFQLTESRVFIDPKSVYTQTNNAFHFMLSDERRYQQFRQSVKVIPPVLGLFSIRHIRRFTNQIRVFWWRLRQNHHLIRSFFYHAGKARGVARLVEKSPGHLACLPEIRATFPNAKFICTYRHPVDVFSSYKRRLQVVTDTVATSADISDWLRIRPENFCKLYSANLHIALGERLSNPDNILLIRYEDFTNEPEHWFHRICDFINEPYEANCVRQDAPSLSYWKQDPLLALPISRNTKVWSDHISRTTATLIEMQLVGVMKEVGYASYTGAPNLYGR